MKQAVIFILLLVSILLSQAFTFQEGVNGYDGCQDAVIALLPDEYHFMGYSKDTSLSSVVKEKKVNIAETNFGNKQVLGVLDEFGCKDYDGYIHSLISFEGLGNHLQKIFGEATLTLSVDDSFDHSDISYPDSPIYISLVTTEWNEEEVTYKSASKNTPWNNIHMSREWGSDSIYGGGDISLEQSVSLPVNEIVGGKAIFDIMPLIEIMQSTPEKYQGFMLYSNRAPSYNLGENTDTTLDCEGLISEGVSFASSEHPDLSKRPKLSIIVDDDLPNQSSKNIHKNHEISIQVNATSLSLRNETDAQQEVHFYNLLGKEVLRPILLNTGANVTLNNSDLPSGCILIKTVTGNRTNTSKIVIY